MLNVMYTVTDLEGGAPPPIQTQVYNAYYFKIKKKKIIRPKICLFQLQFFLKCSAKLSSPKLFLYFFSTLTWNSRNFVHIYF